MPAKKRPVNTVLDLAAKDSEDQDDGSDDDLPLSSLLVSPEEQVEREKDAEFLNDVPSISKSPRNNVVSSDDDAEGGADRRVSGRLRKTSSAVKPPVPSVRGARQGLRLTLGAHQVERRVRVLRAILQLHHQGKRRAKRSANLTPIRPQNLSPKARAKETKGSPVFGS